MLVTKPRNGMVLAFLAKRRPNSPVIVLPDAVTNAYDGCGCHPDIVERLWDQLGRSLPSDCRFVIHGTPALAHPESGVIFGVCIGTQYGLLLPDDICLDAKRSGLKTSTTWTGGETMSIAAELGEGWLFGAWSDREREWCDRAYAAAREAP